MKTEFSRCGWVGKNSPGVHVCGTNESEVEPQGGTHR